MTIFGYYLVLQRRGFFRLLNTPPSVHQRFEEGSIEPEEERDYNTGQSDHILRPSSYFILLVRLLETPVV